MTSAKAGLQLTNTPSALLKKAGLGIVFIRVDRIFSQFLNGIRRLAT
jgi:hypothetical protein